MESLSGEHQLLLRYIKGGQETNIRAKLICRIIHLQIVT